MIANPDIFDYKSQDEEIKALREWSWVFEKYLSAVDEGYMKDLKEVYDTPNEKFDMDLATRAEKSRCIKLYGLLASLMGGRALQLLRGGVLKKLGNQLQRQEALHGQHVQ